MKATIVAVPDLVSNSYFPAIAAIELGFFSQGRARCRRTSSFSRTTRPMRRCATAGSILSPAPAHAASCALSRSWQGCKLLAALAQGMYWLLVLRIGPRCNAGRCRRRQGPHRSARRRMVDQGLKQPLDRRGPRSRARRRAHRRRSRRPARPACRSAWPQRKRSRTASSTASGRTPWARRTPSAAASARSILDVRRGLGPGGGFPLHACRSWRRATDAIERDPDHRSLPACAPWSRCSAR